MQIPGFDYDEATNRYFPSRTNKKMSKKRKVIDAVIPCTMPISLHDYLVTRPYEFTDSTLVYKFEGSVNLKDFIADYNFEGISSEDLEYKEGQFAYKLGSIAKMQDFVFPFELVLDESDMRFQALTQMVDQEGMHRQLGHETFLHCSNFNTVYSRSPNYSFAFKKECRGNVFPYRDQLMVSITTVVSWNPAGPIFGLREVKPFDVYCVEVVQVQLDLYFIYAGSTGSIKVLRFDIQPDDNAEPVIQYQESQTVFILPNPHDRAHQVVYHNDDNIFVTTKSGKLHKFEHKGFCIKPSCSVNYSPKNTDTMWQPLLSVRSTFVAQSISGVKGAQIRILTSSKLQPVAYISLTSQEDSVVKVDLSHEKPYVLCITDGKKLIIWNFIDGNIIFLKPEIQTAAFGYMKGFDQEVVTYVCNNHVSSMILG